SRGEFHRLPPALSGRNVPGHGQSASRTALGGDRSYNSGQRPVDLLSSASSVTRSDVEISTYLFGRDRACAVGYLLPGGRRNQSGWLYHTPRSQRAPFARPSVECSVGQSGF